MLRLAKSVIFCTTLVNLVQNVQAETIGLDLTLSEGASNALLKTQVFPHPIGVHNGDAYDIYLDSPNINYEPGQIIFSANMVIHLNVNGTPIDYEYEFAQPISFGDDLSINGINAFLEGIPTVINSWEIPEWAKTIIIEQYDGLNLTFYPNAILAMANETIPDEIDITVTDITFISWSAEHDQLVFGTSITVDANGPVFSGKWKYSGCCGFMVKFSSNVARHFDTLYWGRSTNTTTRSYSFDSVEIPAGGYSAPFLLETNPGGLPVPMDMYRVQVIFKSSTGWIGITFRIQWDGSPQNVWYDMEFYNRL